MIIQLVNLLLAMRHPGLLSDIESDLEGNDTESTFITQQCKKLRTDHSLTESLFENVRDFDRFTEGLECLRNADKYAYEPHNYSVPSRIKSRVDELNNIGEKSIEMNNANQDTKTVITKKTEKLEFENPLVNSTGDESKPMRENNSAITNNSEHKISQSI